MFMGSIAVTASQCVSTSTPRAAPLKYMRFKSASYTPRNLAGGPAPVLPARHGATPQTAHPQACPEEPILSARFNPFPSASPVPSPLCPLFSMEIRVPLSLCPAPRSHATPSQPWALPLRRRAQLRVHSLAHRQWQDIEGVFLPHASPRTSLVHSPSPAPAMALISSF